MLFGDNQKNGKNKEQGKTDEYANRLSLVFCQSAGVIYYPLYQMSVSLRLYLKAEGLHVADKFYRDFLHIGLILTPLPKKQKLVFRFCFCDCFACFHHYFADLPHLFHFLSDRAGRTFADEIKFCPPDF